MSNHKLEIGAHVIYITPDRRAVNALIEVVHSQGAPEEHFATYGTYPCVNLVFLQPDGAMTDQYGRQKGHASSCCHGSTQGVPQGYCWLWPDEVPDFEVGKTVIFESESTK